MEFIRRGVLNGRDVGNGEKMPLSSSGTPVPVSEWEWDGVAFQSEIGTGIGILEFPDSLVVGGVFVVWLPRRCLGVTSWVWGFSDLDDIAVAVGYGGVPPRCGVTKL